jgi:hypothetical protein
MMIASNRRFAFCYVVGCCVRGFVVVLAMLCQLFVIRIEEAMCGCGRITEYVLFSYCGDVRAGGGLLCAA